MKISTKNNVILVDRSPGRQWSWSCFGQICTACRSGPVGCSPKPHPTPAWSGLKYSFLPVQKTPNFAKSNGEVLLGFWWAPSPGLFSIWNPLPSPKSLASCRNKAFALDLFNITGQLDFKDQVLQQLFTCPSGVWTR